MIGWSGIAPIASGSFISNVQSTKNTLLLEMRDKLVSLLESQRDALDANDDDISYSGVENDIQTAYNEAVQAIADYNSSWSYAQFATYIYGRLGFTATRKTQVESARKTASDGIYDRRYSWLDMLVNRKSGSWEKLESGTRSLDLLDYDISKAEDQKAAMEEWRDG